MFKCLIIIVNAHKLIKQNIAYIQVSVKKRFNTKAMHNCMA